MDAARFIEERYYTDRDGALSLRLRRGERSDFSRDWTHLLGPGESILSSEWETDGGGILTYGSDGRVTTVWLEEETMVLAGKDFVTVTNTIETSDGRADSWTVRLYPPHG